MSRSATSRDYQWVTPRIALGSAVSEPEHVRVLVSDGITHVLDCRMGAFGDSMYSGTGIVYRQHGVPDDGKPKPDEWFFKGIDFATGALRWPWSRVLVHCRFGMSRSPTMVYAILRAQGLAAEEARERISKARVVARVTYPDDAERAARRWLARHG
jgi:hypothetical protein